VSTRKSLPVINYREEDVLPDTQNSHSKGVVCDGCELKDKSRIVGQGDSKVDIMLVSESPSWASACNKRLFAGRGGQIIRSTVKSILDADAKLPDSHGFGKLKRYETYAVQCEAEKEGISKKTLDRCSIYLHSAIKTRQPKIILAFGANALKAVTGSSQKFTEVRGKVITASIGSETYKVLPTFSSKALLAKVGVYNLFKADIIQAFKIAAVKEEGDQAAKLEQEVKDYRIPATIEEVAAICQEIIEYSGEGGDPNNWAITVDTETNSLHPERDDSKVICVSFAWDTGKATAIPLWHKDSPFDVKDVLPHVKAVLECPKPKAFHNYKFDNKFLELRHGLTVNNVRWCTLVGEHFLNENQSGSYGLKVLGRTYFPEFTGYSDHVHELSVSKGIKIAEELLAATKGKKKSKAKGLEEVPNFDVSIADARKILKVNVQNGKPSDEDGGFENMPIDQLLLYAAIDTDLTRRLLRHQFKRLKDEGANKIRALMQTLSVPASRTLGKMEFEGFRVDRAYAQDLFEDKLKRVIDEKTVKIRRHWDGGPTGTKEFMLNSPADIGYLLYMRGVVTSDDADPADVRNRKTYLIPGLVEFNEKSGNWKTDKATLRALAEKADCRFAKDVLEYRAAFKARSNFLSETLELSKHDGYMHTNFHLHGTATGRLSSSNLNLQNIPSYLAGYNIKKMFIPDDPETELVVNADYKGAEIRIFAAYSGDQNLIDALNKGQDSHCFFASRIYNEPYEDLEAVNEGRFTGDPARAKYLKQLRSNVKRVVFGILYGAGPRKIAETAGISHEDAIQVIELMFNMFPSIRNYVESTKMAIDKLLYVETLVGRRRRFPLVHTSSFFRSDAHRKGVNMKIQSQSSDIVLGQLVEVGDNIEDLGGRLLITVHDSLVFTIKKKYAHQLPDFIQYYCMDRVREKFPWMPVDFKCDVELGPSYGELDKLDTYLKTHQVTPLTEDEKLDKVFDEEIINELREDEEKKKDDEEVAG
jgi:uracil-DNA glycosylase family 4